MLATCPAASEAPEAGGRSGRLPAGLINEADGARRHTDLQAMADFCRSGEHMAPDVQDGAGRVQFGKGLVSHLPHQPLSQFSTFAAKLRKSLVTTCLATRSGPVLTRGRVSGGSSCAERARTDAHGCRLQLANGGVWRAATLSRHNDRLAVMGNVIDLTAAVWRRVAALELEVAECQPVAARVPRSTGTVINLNAAVGRRVAALELQVAECRQAVVRTPCSSWWHKVYRTELIEAERRLSIAEGMCRDERA